MSEQRFYEIVADELRRKSVRDGLWTRAVAETGEEGDAARALYIRLRVAELVQLEHAERARFEAQRREADLVARQEPAKPASTIGPAMIALVLVALIGAAAFWFLRRPTSGPVAEKPAGPVEVSRTNLALVDGRLRQNGATTPFTGTMVEHYPDGRLRSRSVISNGVLQGLSEGWYTNAQLQVTEYFREGVSHGLRTKWHPNGTNQSEANIADGKLHGSFKKWHENGALSEQVEFVGGEPTGTSTSYFPSGFLKARVTMKDGKIVEQTFWKDGEKRE